jgi:hypothetical protein
MPESYKESRLLLPAGITRKARRRSSLFYAKNAEDPDTSDEEKYSSKSSMTSLMSSPLSFCQTCKEQAVYESPVLVSASNSTPPSPEFDGLQDSTRRVRRRSSHREPFVGSYEESLLSRRMASVACSPPVPFHARIGVLGKGKYCGECPAHVCSTFDAVFYDWDFEACGGRGSPYVGGIDLDDLYGKRNTSKKFPGYRIPRQGQIQIVLSNIQKTAVHFFLIPYDLRKMPGGTKTFIRQKVFAQQPKTLVHLVHLQVVCPNKSKLYLYGEIRLAFQNRLPAVPGSSVANMKIETVEGGFGKWASEANHQVGYSSMDSKREHGGPKCANCEQALTGELKKKHEEQNIITSREDLDNKMMEDINMSMKLL